MDDKQTKKNRRVAGPGRPKGSANRVTADLRTLITESLTVAGGVKYLADQAVINPQAYLSLIGKALPRDYNLGGQDSNPVVVKIIRFGNENT